MIVRNRFLFFILLFVVSIAFGDTPLIPHTDSSSSEPSTIPDSSRTIPRERPASPMSPLGLTIGKAGEDIYIAADAVGIGTAIPSAKLDVDGYLILQSGTSINEFSTDGTMAGNSDDVVPTEKAVKTYVDNTFSSGGDNWGSQTVQTDASLSGDGTLGVVLKVSNGEIVSESTNFKLHRIGSGW